MPTCTSCSAELRPEWKYCIYCGTAIIPGAIRPEVGPTRRFNSVAILALVLACIGGAAALIFGHIAIAQIARTGERGLGIARVATVLGYLWVGVTLLLLWLYVPR